MVICPPNTTPVQPPDGSGWAYRNTPWGTEIITLKRPTYNGLAAWSKPCPLLGGGTLFQYNKSWLAAVAKFWKSGYPATIGYNNTNGASNPFTNVDGTYTTHNGFELFMHCQLTSRFSGNFPNFGWNYFGYEMGAQAFQTAIQESSQPTPSITGATLNTDWTYSITVSNWQGSTIDIAGAAILVTTPGCYATNSKRLNMVDVAPAGANLNSWSDGGRGVAACLMKPYPAGTRVLIGLRGVSSRAYNGILPTPAAWIEIEVT